MRKPLYIVIYPYRFTEHIFNYLELDVFQKHCEVQVWDLSPLLTANFSNTYSTERLEKSEIIIIRTLSEFIKRLKNINSKIYNLNICVFNALPYQSILDLICNYLIYRYLKKPSVAILKAYYGGIPTHFNIKEEKATKETSYLMRIKRLVKTSTSFTEIRKRVGSQLFNKLAIIIPSSATHLLIAGNHYLDAANFDKTVSKSAQKIFIHCQDYSNSLLFRNVNPKSSDVNQEYAVLLDAPGPMFTSDYTILKRKVFLTTEIWYPTLTSFFDKVESETGVIVKIAGHYKAKHPFIAPCFGNREVHYNKTKELVQNCKFVITRSSAATSYAVLFGKPVLFIYSDQLKDDDLAMHDIYGMADMLGTTPININEFQENIKEYLTVNQNSYEDYKNACLTSSDSLKPNVQIIVEDIMNVKTDGIF